MKPHKLAGKPAPISILDDMDLIKSDYESKKAESPVSFGTSGHRGTSLNGSFNKSHIEAITQSVCNYRKKNGIKGPLFLGFDTHALSYPAYKTALEIFAANNVNTIIHKNNEFTPTPVISHAILTHNSKSGVSKADGVIITPSHNPPGDGGIKYNSTHGGPAESIITNEIEKHANQILKNNNQDVKKITYEKAIHASHVHETDLMSPFIDSLSDVIDFDVIAKSKIKIGVDPLGGACVHFWEPLAEKYRLNIDVVNRDIDESFSFMPVDSDGKIRMDCSSPFAMANLISMANTYDIAWGNDPDGDRHGIVCSGGLMKPNDFLSVAIWYLLRNRPDWKSHFKIGKTLVSSSMIDKVVSGSGRSLFEVPVGFKWFVQGLYSETLAFAGEESAGASFLKKDGSVWTTDKDGFSLALLAAEILAKTGKTPMEIYREKLVPDYGDPFYLRADSTLTEKDKIFLSHIKAEDIKVENIAGIPIQSVRTKAQGNNKPMGGIKIELKDGSWFALRPSGTEPKMKLYIESYGGEELWKKIREDALNVIFGNL